MYAQRVDKKLRKKLEKLGKKNIQKYKAIESKMESILENPQHYKNLRGNLAYLKRVHFRPFVLTFSVDEENKIVTFEDFDHHDNIYLK